MLLLALTGDLFWGCFRHCNLCFHFDGCFVGLLCFGCLCYSVISFVGVVLVCCMFDFAGSWIICLHWCWVAVLICCIGGKPWVDLLWIVFWGTSHLILSWVLFIVYFVLLLVVIFGFVLFLIVYRLISVSVVGLTYMFIVPLIASFHSSCAICPFGLLFWLACFALVCWLLARAALFILKWSLLMCYAFSAEVVCGFMF